MVNWWFGARWFGFLGSPYERDCYLRVPDSNPKPPGPKPPIYHHRGNMIHSTIQVFSCLLLHLVLKNPSGYLAHQGPGPVSSSKVNTSLLPSCSPIRSDPLQDPIPGSQFWTSSGGTCEAKEVGFYRFGKNPVGCGKAGKYSGANRTVVRPSGREVCLARFTGSWGGIDQITNQQSTKTGAMNGGLLGGSSQDL